ncbi:glutamyl-tRNA reductase [Catalinimonas niigatensis]|uniref:glutamyl-tRNA reductase n=1 Tax=Catalinimonas niigatensis TaxID=1397264 RepID=UPI002666E79D|nr:glutamyl-tRNA reductase [Catalinimonas niigatensis]WPP52296.1 glutamyl-tRNA reductase [Catalinimonas niigatensis]
MHNNFKLVSLTYKNSPIEIRERVALDDQQSTDLLRKLKSILNIPEAFVLSTCNRTEVYYTSENDLSGEIIKLIIVEKGLLDVTDLEQYFVKYNDEKEAMRHLFHVAIGLESQLIGDMQISNQVKRAYQTCADENMAGPFLHRLLHTIFFTNKRIVQETPFRDGAASVSYAASELVYDLAAEIINPRVLVIGLGEIGTDVCKNIGDSDNVDKLFKVTVINRTNEKATKLAAQYGFASRLYDEVYDAILESDIIISAVSLQKPLITKSLFEQREHLSYKYLIDLSVPRSIEAEVENIPGALVYNIDDIRNKADEAMRKRINAIPDVKAIIEEALTEVDGWLQEMEVSPTIHRLKNALEQIRQEEIARYLKNLDDKEADYIEKITKGMMQKIIKLPVLQLKAACKRGEAETLIDVLNNLFDLEKQSNPKEIRK